jgi:hypothetical protein
MIKVEIIGQQRIDITKLTTDISFSQAIDLTSNKATLSIQMFSTSIDSLFTNGDKFALKGKQLMIKYLDQLLYWGFIDSISIETILDFSGLEITTGSLTCDSIFTRMLNSEIVHSNSATLYGTVRSEVLATYAAYLRQENDFAKILQYTLDQFAFAKVPQSLFEQGLKVSDLINICDGVQGYHLPQLAQYANDNNKVYSILKQGLVNPNDKLLTLQKFMTIFQQTPELVEFFFLLVPYQEDYKIEQSKKILYKALGAVPTIVFRYKPLPPKFNISKKSLEKVRDTRILSRPVVELTFTEDTSDRSKIEYLEIPVHQILSISYAYDDEMINAVSVYNGVSASNSSIAFSLAESLNHLVMNEDDAEEFGISHKVITNFYVEDPSPLTSAKLTELGFCLYGDGAYYSKGIVKLGLAFTQALTVGQWVSCQGFTAYITKIEYKIGLSTSGIQEGSIDLHFERGSKSRLPLFYPKQVKKDYPQNNQKTAINPIPKSQIERRG